MTEVFNLVFQRRTMVEETPKSSKNTKNNGHQCDGCLSVFASKRTLAYHQEKAHLDTKIYCDTCGLSLNSSMALMAHKKIHVWEKDSAEQRHLSPVYECSVCDLQTRSPRGLVFHYQDIHPSYDRSINTKSSKKKSIPRFVYDENHNEILKCADFIECDLWMKKVKCPLCSVFYGENRIKGHLMTAHPFYRSLFCTRCAAIIVDQEEMGAHLLEHTEGGDLHTCDICECLYTSAEALATHRRLHTTQRPFSCSVCQKEFQSKTGAIAHFYSHLKVEMLRDSDEDTGTASQKGGTSTPFQAHVMPQTDLDVGMPQTYLNLAMFQPDNVAKLTTPQRDNCCLMVMEDSEDFVNVWD